jgi:hypothetical protein
MNTQFTITHTLVSTVMPSLLLLGNGFNGGRSSSSGFLNCPQPQPPASNSNSSQRLSPSSSKKEKLKSELCYDQRSVSQSVLVSSHIWGPRPDFCYCHTVAGLFMWGTLSDERTGLSFTIADGSCQRSHIYRP